MSVRPMSLAAPRTTSMPPRQTDEVPFVGRESELSRLASRVLGATNRAGAPIVIFGDAGMGKSRLVSELLNVVEQDGAAVVIYARCRELSALVPYSPLREALSRLATVTKKNERTARVQAATNLAIEADPELASALVPELGRGQTDAETRRSLLRPGGAKRVATLIHRIVTAIAAELPVLVAIEDLHWGDESTLAALEALSGLIEDARVLLLGTTRPPSRVTWRDAEMMELGPLDRSENERLLCELTRGSDEELLRTLQTRVPLLGAGNPLFNIQVIRNLEVDGFLGRTPFGTLALSSRNPADYRAQSSIEEALRRGVDNLSTESLEVLGVAALLGRQFLRSDLSALGLFEPQRIERALEEAERRCLCLNEPSETSFVHEVVLEQLERRTVRKDHREHHKRIAKALERRGADPGTLARHLERAGMTMRAANALVESALAARSADPIGASQKLRHAIDLVDPEPPSAERNDLLIAATAELCRARSLLGGTEELLALLERCTAHTPAANAELFTSYALVRFARGELDLARAAAEQAISAAGNDATLDRHRSSAMNVLGRVRASAGRLQDALAALGGGCRVAERAGEWLELCHARALYGATLGEAGDPEGAEREIQAAADLAERLSDPARFLGVWLACAIFAEARCDLDLGVGSTAQLLAYAEEHKLGGHYHYLGTLYAGRHQFHAGHVHRARLLLTNALNLSRVVGTSLGQALAHAFLGDVHLVEGHLQEALAAYDQALELGAGPDGDERAYCLAIIGRMHATALAQGHPGEVRRLGEDAIARISSSGHRALLVPALERFAEALEEVGSLGAVAAVRAHYEVISSSLDAPGATFWPRIPDVDVRATGMEPRLYWRTRNDKPRASSEWFLPTEPVSPSALLTTRAAKIRTVETTAHAYTSRSAVAAIPRTATRTGLLDSLSTMEGFLPNFEAVLDAMFEKNGT